MPNISTQTPPGSGCSSLSFDRDSTGLYASTTGAARAALVKADWDSPLATVRLWVNAGQSNVYRVTTDRGATFAAKVFVRTDELVHERTFYERLAALGVNHPSLPRYYGVKNVKDVKGELALVTGFINGADLKDLGKVLHTHMKQVPPDANVAVAAVVSLAKELFAGLAFLEGLALSHGDIKPGNVMVSKEGELKILDFGYWGSTNHPPSINGTLGYLPPEAFRAPDGANFFDRSKSDCYGAANTILGLLSACKISQNFEEIEPFSSNLSTLKFFNDTKKFCKSGLTAENFSQSKKPEAALGACGTFFGAPAPNAMAVALRTSLSEHFFVNRKTPPSAAAVQGYSQALKALHSIPPEAQQPASLAEELRALLSRCIRADWKDRPSAATMLARLQGLALRFVPANDLAKVPDFLKRMVQKTKLERSKPPVSEPALPSVSVVLRLPPAPHCRARDDA